MIHQLVGGLRAGMGYCGAANIPELQREARADPHHAGRRPRKPRPRRDHHEGSAELPDGVDAGSRVHGPRVTGT